MRRKSRAAISLQPARAELPAVNWGDRVFSANEGFPLIGVLDYNFGKFSSCPCPALLRAERGALPGENATAASPSDFTVCTFNLHGLGCGAEQHPDPADYDAALARRARIIAGTLAGCTLIGLQETGAPADAEALARRLVEEYDLPYIAVALPGPGTFDPDFPLTNGFLLRSDRFTALAVDSPQTCTAQDYDVPLTGGNSCPPGHSRSSTARRSCSTRLCPAPGAKTSCCAGQQPLEEQGRR